MSEFHVVIEMLCQCAQKHNLTQVRTFTSQEEAEEHAYEWADHLNNSYCRKHGFDVIKVDKDFVISVESGGFVEACDING